MATLTIKNVPDDLYQRLSRMASRNRRSLNNEAIVLLEKSSRAGESDVEATLERIRTLRRQVKDGGAWLTEDFINQAKNQGRP